MKIWKRPFSRQAETWSLMNDSAHQESFTKVNVVATIPRPKTLFRDGRGDNQAYSTTHDIEWAKKIWHSQFLCWPNKGVSLERFFVSC